MEVESKGLSLKEEAEDERSLTTLSSVDESSFVGSVEETESVKAMNNRKKLAANVTTLLFIQKDGSRYEKKLAIKVQTYSELQREIARLYPGTREMYVIQDERGARIRSDGFVPRQKFVVRGTFLTPPSFEHLQQLPYNWEQTDYHEVRLKKQAEERAEQESAQMVSFL